MPPQRSACRDTVRSPHWRLFPKRKSSSLLFPASTANSRNPCEELCEIVIARMHFIPRIRKVYGKSGGFKLCCAVNGFGAFSSRTIFAHVEPSSQWTALRTLVYDSLLAKCPGTAKRDARTFVPHITVANRDIPPGAIEDALSYFDSLDLHESFDVQSITLFAMRDGTWTERETFAMTELY